MEPLSLRKRKFYLFGLILVFILFVPLLIFYAIGYRLDDALSLIKTGGVFIHTERSGSVIYINDEQAKNSSLLNKSVLVQDLRPDEYEVRVERDGYTSWKKTLSVYPEFVTEARVLMIKNDIKSEPIIYLDKLLQASSTYSTTTRDYAKIVDFFGLREEVVATSSKKDLLVSKVNQVTKKDVATSSKIDEEISAHKYDQYSEIFEIKKADLIDVEFFEQRNHVYWIEEGDFSVAWIGRSEDKPFYFCDQDKCEDKIVVDFEEDITNFALLPGRDDAMFFLEGDKLLVTELDERSGRTILFPFGDMKIEDLHVDGQILYLLSDEIIFEVKEI